MSDTKKCPFCGEDILAVAIKCKHCGSDLSQVIASNAAGNLGKELVASIETVIREKRHETTGKLYFTHDIPSDKLEKAKNKFAGKLSSRERVLILGENKALMFHLSGFILTDSNFYYYGVNDYYNGLAGSRKGVVPIHQIKSFVIKKGFNRNLGSYDHFILNGMGPDESDLIPKYFEFGVGDLEFLGELFGACSGTFIELDKQIQKAAGAPTLQNTFASTAPKKAEKTDNPIEAGEKPKAGCFKSGCMLIILIPLCVGFLALALWALWSGLMS